MLGARQRWKFPFLLSTFFQIHNRYGIQAQGTAADKENTAACLGAGRGGWDEKARRDSAALRGSV